MSLLRLQRRRPTTITDKHKEFLAELQAERNRLIEERAKHEAKRQEQKARFAARQAEFRQAVNNNEFGESGDGEAESKYSDHSPQYGHYASASADIKSAQEGHGAKGSHAHSSQQQGEKQQHQQQGGVKQRRKGGAQRPAWAMTPQQADAVDDADAEELLNYFEDLDVENFLEDVEAKAVAAGVSSRLAEVESQAAHTSELLQQAEELWEQEEVVVPAGSHVGEAGEGWEWVGEPTVVQSEGTHQQEGKTEDGQYGTPATMIRLVRRRRRRSKWESEGPQGPPGGGHAGEGKLSDDDDAASVAHSVMSTASVRSVHSKRSMEALVKREKQQRAASGAGGGLPAVPESPPAEGGSGGVFARAGAAGAVQPRIVQHRTGEGDRAAKDLVGSLPYKHLHPGV